MRPETWFNKNHHGKTPERNAIVAEIEEREKKKKKRMEPVSGCSKNLFEKEWKEKKNLDENQNLAESSDSETDRAVVSQDTDSEAEESEDEVIEDFVIAKIKRSGRVVHFATRVDIVDDDGFLKRFPGKCDELPSFVIDEYDGASWSAADIVSELPSPTACGTAKRAQSRFPKRPVQSVSM